ncbi:hypothetical protein H257_01568 [Aphanomyces astaci]|uniref:protein-tyrosine-phosphatase n=1 Tax=Aphanomyces astaci TaxID=112090 RepID=W4H9N6_APHAT|nr:hypothetical protein H257_01568 [Aphanomyces astaci]ETV88276.1 hypothetical protein H257_01568 [Aphanomyces astaci]|eukprot:XP_009823139.1 hypothetical protein H257_01568 [Aphanomyces astaci]
MLHQRPQTPYGECCRALGHSFRPIPWSLRTSCQPSIRQASPSALSRRRIWLMHVWDNRIRLCLCSRKSTRFDAAAYDHLAQLEHGDMTWIVPGKVLAFSGPLMERREFAPTKVTMLAQDYAKVFNTMGVSCVVRLNEQCYDRKKFVHAGLNHVELIFPDGSTPADSILDSFLNLCERERGAVAVHCKAGLGRTGTVIAAYIIKHYRFTATEAIAWCRLCRPGCIVGPQQHFLAYKQASLWATPLPSNHQPPPKLKPQLQTRKSFT